MSNSTPTYLYLLNGTYLGFVSNDYIFSRDGIYLGWVENGIAWNSDGSYGGKVTDFNGKTYILKQTFLVAPIPRIPKSPPISTTLPAPLPNIPAVIPPIGTVDGLVK